MTVPGPTEISFPEVTVMGMRTYEATSPTANRVAGQYVEFDDTVLTPGVSGAVNFSLGQFCFDPEDVKRFVGFKCLSADRATEEAFGVLLEDDLQRDRSLALGSSPISPGTLSPVKVMLRGVTKIKLGSTSDMTVSYAVGKTTVSHAPETVSVGDPIDVGQASNPSAIGKWEKAWKPAAGSSLAAGRGKVMALEAGSPGDTIRVYVDAYKNSVGYKGIG